MNIGSASGSAGFVWRQYLQANGYKTAPDECFVQVCASMPSHCVAIPFGVPFVVIASMNYTD